MTTVRILAVLTSGAFSVAAQNAASQPATTGGATPAQPAPPSSAPAQPSPGSRVYPGLRNLPANSAPNGQTIAPRSPAASGLGAYSEENLPPGQPIYTNATGQVYTNYPGIGSFQTNSITGTNWTANSKVTPIQLENINRLAVALHDLELPSRDAAGARKKLLDNLQAAPITNPKPPPASISKLADQLEAVVPTLNLTAPQRRQLAIDLNMALNSGKLSDTEAQRVTTDVHNLLRGSALNNPTGVNQLLDFISSIVAKVQSSLAQSPPEPAPQLQQNAEQQSGVGTVSPGQAGQGQGSGTPQPEKK